jgi:hypothetical protein
MRCEEFCRLVRDMQAVMESRRAMRRWETSSRDAAVAALLEANMLSAEDQRTAPA